MTLAPDHALQGGGEALAAFSEACAKVESRAAGEQDAIVLPLLDDATRSAAPRSPGSTWATSTGRRMPFGFVGREERSG